MPLDNDSRFRKKYLHVPEDYQGGWLGVDAGMVHLLVDSDGDVYPKSPEDRERFKEIIERSYKVRWLSRDDKAELESLCARASRQVAKKAAKRKLAVGLEKLQKTGFDPVFRLICFRVPYALGTACLMRHVPMKFVGWVNTSRSCPKCLFCADENRPSRDSFHCQHCGFAGPADHIAAMNIARRAAGLPLGSQKRSQLQTPKQTPLF